MNHAISVIVCRSGLLVALGELWQLLVAAANVSGEHTWNLLCMSPGNMEIEWFQ